MRALCGWIVGCALVVLFVGGASLAVGATPARTGTLSVRISGRLTGGGTPQAISIETTREKLLFDNEIHTVFDEISGELYRSPRRLGPFRIRLSRW